MVPTPVATRQADRRLVYVKAADLDRWQCRPLDTIDVLDLKDRPVGRLDGIVIDWSSSRPVYIAVRDAKTEHQLRWFLAPVGDAWFDETTRAVRIDATQPERIPFDPNDFERMPPAEADAYERQVLANCCPELGFHRDGTPDYSRQERFRCPAWLRPSSPGESAVGFARTNRARGGRPLRARPALQRDASRRRR
jgi:hypothetical protein